MPWSGNVSLPFRFYNNGSVWGNSPVVAVIYGARGLMGASTLTTDATGTAPVSANISRTPFTIDDYAFGGVHFLFRAAVGSNANSSDGFFWAEDDQPVAFNLNDGFLSLFGSSDVSVSVRPTAFGTPFGAAVKYTGPLDVTGWEGAVMVLLNGPDTYQWIYGTGDVAELTTSSSFSSRSFAMKPGALGEFFGVIDLPSYFPPRNLTLLAGMAELAGAVYAGLGSDSSRLAVVTLTPGQSLSGFSPSAESRLPEVYAKDMWIGSGIPTRLAAHGFDDTITFPEQWNWTWTISLATGPMTVYGFNPRTTITPTGDFPATVTVRDGAGRQASASFTIHVGDFTAPFVSAGPDRALNGGISVAFDAVVTDNDPDFATTGTVHWNFSYNETNYTMDGSHLVFTFWRPGTINLTAVAIDAAGNRATDTVTVTVLPPDIIKPQILGLGGNRTEPLGLQLRLVALVSDNDPNFPGNARSNWSFMHLGSPVVVNGTTANYTFWQEGNITITFTVEDFWGNSNTSNVTIKFIAGSSLPPIADAGANITVRTGERVDLVGNATTEDPLFPLDAIFTWTFFEGGDPVTLVNQLAFYAFRLEGAYTITLTVEDRWGKDDQDTVQVVVIGPDTVPPLVTPIANKNIVVNTTLVLEPTVSDNSIVFSYTGNYTWTVEFEGNASTLYGKRIVYNFTKVGIYNWTLVVRDGALNPSELIRFYVRVELPDERPPLVTATADSYRVAVGTTVQFHGTATDQGVNFTDDRVFNWTIRSGNKVWYLTGINPFFKFEAPGQYSVTLRVNDTAGNIANESFIVDVGTAPGGGFLPAWPAYGAVTALGAAAVAALVVRARRARGPRDL
jgi:PKD repeat protein